MRAMIMASTEKERRLALKKLLPMQRADFAGLFKAMKGFPVPSAPLTAAARVSCPSVKISSSRSRSLN